jgi:UDP:flavonoid glycosyltransferase YjiC (YdhE family)
MAARKKALAAVIPASGHINLMCCLIKELVTQKNFHVILYSVEKYKNLITKSGAEFRMFENIPGVEDEFSDFKILEIFELIMKGSKIILPQLIQICNDEKPDLILCDAMTAYGRYLINYLEIMDKKKKLNYKLPKSVIVHPSFAFCRGIYPSYRQAKICLEKSKIDFDFFKLYIKLCLRQRKMNQQFGLKLPSNVAKMAHILTNKKQLQICGVLHELQPNADNLTHLFKFIGCCISDEVRNFDINNEKLKELLETFEPKNLINIEEANNKIGKKLIYASLGTVFNKNISVFERIIQAFETFDQESSLTSSNIKFNDLELIISCGNAAYENFQFKINNENYKIPENVLILPSVPQIEILKRASLFITHAGMNSVSETIHYGVPVICLPINVDQPLVALRICDELKFGKRFDYAKFTSDEMRTSIHEIFRNETYLKNILEFTKLSRKTNGCEIGANLIDDYLNH